MLEDILLEQKKSFASGVQTELRGQMNRVRGVSIRSGSVAVNQRTEDCGISARVYKNGVYGFSSIAEYSKDAAVSVLRAASENAEFMDRHIAKNRGPLPGISTGIQKLNKSIVDIEQKRYLDFARELDSYINEKYKNIISRSVSIREDSRENLLYTSDGFDSHTTTPRAAVHLSLSAQTASGMPVDVREMRCGFGNFDDLYQKPSDLFPLVDYIYEHLMKKKEGIYADAGYKTVVLDGMMAGMLAHEAVGHTVEGDIVLGGSVAGPALNHQVASEKVSLVDFAHTAFGVPAPLPVYVDEEGTKCEDAELIKDGILVGYMNSRETAQHFNMKPQGNARAYCFSDEPLVRMRNTCILPGTDKVEDIISSVEDGYYLIQSGNGQADMTGEFIFGVTLGYEIKHGKLGRALLDTTVSGIAFDMLKTVDMVSDTVTWSSSGHCGKKQPMPVGMGGPAMRCKIMIGGR